MAIDDDSLAAVPSFYRGFVDRTVAVFSPREAELAKLIENTFRNVIIALVNELAIFRRELGMDVWGGDRLRAHQAVRVHAVRSRTRVGGHCLPIDPSYLS